MSIIYYSTANNVFTDMYIQVRKKEKRFYTTDQVATLPDLHKDDPNYSEWQLRKKSAIRFVQFLKAKKKPLNILDVGCGNGWFSNLLSTINDSQVLGVDINIPELEQGYAVFKKSNLTFAYADLFADPELNNQKFDIIVFNSCFQYFNEVALLLKIANGLLTKMGEIHIIDTPFYKHNEIEDARLRTHAYYKKLGFPEMSAYYFHHCFDELGKCKIMYNPSTLLKLLRNDSPFCWLKIEKH